MRFAFIATEKANYPVALLCRVLQVSRSGCYAWQQPPAAQRALQNQSLGLEIAAIFCRESRPLRQPAGPRRVAGAWPTVGAQARGAADAERRLACARAPPLSLHHRL
jgi:hypothetical protein